MGKALACSDRETKEESGIGARTIFFRKTYNAARLAGTMQTKGKPQILLFIFLAVAGIALRYVEPRRLSTAVAGWRPWAATSMVTLYFSDGRFLFPVSRRMPKDENLPRAALQALLDGPGAARTLKTPIPGGVQIRSLGVAGGIASIDLSAAFRDPRADTAAAQTAVVETMTALPGITSVVLSVEGIPLASAVRRIPLLYYATANGLVAVPVAAETAREALTAYLAGPPSPELTGLPDGHLLVHEYDSANGLLSLKFAYTPAIRELALDNPSRMRTVLLGLISSLTEFPEVRAVRLDFGGQTRLGLGQCSDLLGALQPRPELLNDERLLAW